MRYVERVVVNTKENKWTVIKVPVKEVDYEPSQIFEVCKDPSIWCWVVVLILWVSFLLGVSI